MPTLKGLRDYSEHNVLPYFGYSGSYPVNKGTFVKIADSGFLGQDIALAGALGFSVGGTLSERWAVQAVTVPVTATGDKVLGMLLLDGREVDENGQRLVWDTRKAAEMNVFISGQNAPVVIRGQFSYSGILGNPSPGDTAYVNTIDGGLSTTGASGLLAVGKFLSVKNAQGIATVFIDVR